LTKQFPSSIPFAAVLTYSPRGSSVVSKDSRTACYAIKNGRDATVTLAVTRLLEKWQAAGMADFFGDDVVLVPTPRSAPLVAEALWPADKICREIVKQGLARGVEPALQRITAVPKSSFSRPGQRPDVAKHLESMEAHPWVPDGDRVLVVDDVITRGATL
jgi:hypothetical protein